jgi:NAD(P)-dependent dehydrogenase (short-subunit alcohol dehydrogenase family)
VKVADSVAPVTGGASGLGLATDRALHDARSKVTIVDLPSSQGRSIAKELGDGAVFSPGDVTSTEDVAAALDAVSEPGPLRVAVNCAGIGNAIKTVARKGVFPLEDFSKVVGINLIGTFTVIRLDGAIRMAPR